VSRDREQSSPRGPFAAVGYLRVLPGAQQSFLNHILCAGAITRQPHGITPQRCGVLLVEQAHPVGIRIVDFEMYGSAAGGFDDHIAQFDGDVGFGEVAFIDGEQDVAGLGQRGGRLSTISRAGPIPGPSISAAVVAAVIAVGAISMPCTV
jgi:hypothetical protein